MTFGTTCKSARVLWAEPLIGFATLHPAPMKCGSVAHLLEFAPARQRLGGIVWQGSYTFVVNQWGVGHGGFHSQSLHFQPLNRTPTAPVGEGSTLRVIYDCGSGRSTNPTTALKDAVGRMLGDIADGSTIDLLVISHFDHDHVNGLAYLADELAKKRIRVDRVWAPVLTKIEAIYAISNPGLSASARRQYVPLVINPEGRLRQLFDSADISQIPADSQPIPLSANGASRDDVDVEGEIVLTSSASGRGLVARSTAAHLGEALWEIQPYVVESTLVGARSVSGRVRRLLGKTADQCSIDDLKAIAEDSVLLEKFHSAVKKHQKNSPRGSRASSARTGANLSSLCVYSGPVSPYDWCHFRNGWVSVARKRDAVPIAPAWLGTGDAGLLKPQHVDAMKTALSQSRLDRVGISSVPHHGSKHDSGASLWTSLPNVRCATIEANNRRGGTGNSHPHSEVLKELSTRQVDVHTPSAGHDFRWSDKRIR